MSALVTRFIESHPILALLLIVGLLAVGMVLLVQDTADERGEMDDTEGER